MSNTVTGGSPSPFAHACTSIGGHLRAYSNGVPICCTALYSVFLGEVNHHYCIITASSPFRPKLLCAIIWVHALGIVLSGQGAPDDISHADTVHVAQQPYQ